MFKKSFTALGVMCTAIILCTGCTNPITWLQHASDTSNIAPNTAAQSAGSGGGVTQQTNVTNNTTVPKPSDAPKPPSPSNAQSNTQSTLPNSSSSPKSVLPPSVLIDVRALDQYPELPNGCEVTSLAMLLTYLGHPMKKEQLAREEPFDPTKRVQKPDGTTTFWGNPNVGFVGSPFEKNNGYGIYHGPMMKLLDDVLPNQGVDLTKKPFSAILQSVANGIPVVVWDTATFKPTNSWTSWNTPEGPIKVTLQEHAVLLVGYKGKELFINNPLNGKKAQAVNKAQFIAAWKQLGEQAITVKSM